MAELVKNGNFASPNITIPGQAIAPTDWTSVGGSGIFDMYVNAPNIPYNGLPSPSITQGSYIDGGSKIYQNVTFPSTGNYILSFWTIGGNWNFTINNKTNVSLGSIVSQQISYANNTTWVQYKIPFILTGSLTQLLTLEVLSGSYNMCFTGISIVADTTTPCFREGTLISCQKNGTDVEVPIEKLKEYPYLIKTLKHGFLPIHSIGKSLLQNPGNRDRIKRRLYKLSPLNYPEIYTPLYLTGCHGLLVPSLTDKEKQACMDQYEDKVFVTDGQYRLFACLDERAEPYDQEGEFPIYHIALQSEDTLVNYGIYANGLLVESCSIWSLTEKHKHIELFPMETPI